MKTFAIFILTLAAIAAVTYISSKAKNEVDDHTELEMTEQQVMGTGVPDKATEEKIPTH